MNASQTVIRTNGPAEGLAQIAATLGFTPTDSLVAVSLRGERGSVGLVVRIDLADVNGNSIAGIVGHLITDGASRVFIAVYSDDAERADRLAIRAGAVAQVRGVKLVMRVRVGADGYRVDGESAPRPLTDIQSTQTAATNAFHGHTPCDSATQMLPGQAKPADRRAARTARTKWLARPLTERRAEALVVWGRAIRGEATPQIFGQIAGALTDQPTRDAVLLSLIPGTPAEAVASAASGKLTPAQDGVVAEATAKIADPLAGIRPADEAAAAADVLAQVIAHVEDSVAAWTLWGLIAWWGGRGTLALASLGRAVTMAPNYPLAALMGRVVESGKSPGWLNTRQY